MTFFDMELPDLIVSEKIYRHPVYSYAFVDENGHIDCDPGTFRTAIHMNRASSGFSVVTIWDKSQPGRTLLEVFRFAYECFYPDERLPNNKRVVPKDFNFYNRRKDNLVVMSPKTDIKKRFIEFKHETAEEAIRRMKDLFGELDHSKQALEFYDDYMYMIGLPKEFRVVAIKKIKSLGRD